MTEVSLRLSEPERLDADFGKKSTGQHHDTMKTRSHSARSRMHLLITLIATLATTGSVLAEHDGKPTKAMKGAEQLQHLNRPESAQDLKTGDTVAMACSMCKNIAVVRVEKVRGREFLTPGTKHGCAMCGGTVEITGQRVDKKVVTKHTCSKCGEGSAYCCATRRKSKDSAEVEDAHQEHHQKIADEQAEKEDNDKKEQKDP